MTTAEPRIRKVYTPPPGGVGLYFTPEQDMSNADMVAQLSERERELAISGMTEAEQEALAWDSDFWLRPSQLALANSEAWMTVALAGRGWGKSHVLSIAMHNFAMKYPKSRLILLGRTASDVRDVMVWGASGVMNIVKPEERPAFNPSTRKLTWKNGTYALCYSAERADSLRGVQAHASFCDEVAAYKSNPGSGLANALDQARIATRLQYIDNDGRKHEPQIFIATTPKRVPLILDLVKQAEEDPNKVLLVRGPTRANRALSDGYKETMEGMYAGTAIGKQELDGEILTDVDGALLNMDIIEGTRLNTNPEKPDLPDDHWKALPYRIIGVDPSVSSEPHDECGIIAIGATGERKMYQRTAYVLEDASMLAAPDVWAKRVVEMARKYRAVVVAEKNQGGEMVRLVIKQQDPYVPVVLVHASVSKEQRAEPVGTAYERGSVRHVGEFPELEAQLTSWAPKMGFASPDRMDALVHAVTAVLIKPPKEIAGQISIIGNPSEHHLDVKDHSPGGAKGLNTIELSDAEAEKTEDDESNQLIYNKVRRKKNLPIGQRDLRLGGHSSYTAPNRFNRPSSYR